MEDSRRFELEVKLREALREHQHEGLNMIGGVDQLVTRLVHAVEDFLEEKSAARKKTA